MITRLMTWRLSCAFTVWSKGMLVLSRQRDETIMIGDDIEITVVDIRGDKVRLGIEAPSDISVHRKEVYEAIKRENQQAASLNLDDLGSFKVTNEKSDRRSKDGPPTSVRKNGLRAVTPNVSKNKGSNAGQCKSA
jgi:carbon storage regulator